MAVAHSYIKRYFKFDLHNVAALQTNPEATWNIGITDSCGSLYKN